MLPEKIKKAVFAGECEFVCTNFKEYLKKKDRYYFLAKAILNKDYAKYSIYCRHNKQYVVVEDLRYGKFE